MSKSKIEWTNYTWNPVWGCNAGCYYCYAKKRSKRFAGVIAAKETPEKINQLIIEKRLKNFEPTFIWSHFLNFKFPKKPSKIFIGSMSDIAFWKTEWIGMVADVIKYYPQHTFQLLTKYPEVYKTLNKIMPENVWFGVTITNNDDVKKLNDFSILPLSRITFASFEPLTEALTDTCGLSENNELNINWAIIGTMSGIKRIPAKTEWIESLVKDLKNELIPIFIKQLEVNGKVEKDISKFPENLRLREFPIF